MTYSGKKLVLPKTAFQKLWRNATPEVQCTIINISRIVMLISYFRFAQRQLTIFNKIDQKELTDTKLFHSRDIALRIEFMYSHFAEVCNAFIVKDGMIKSEVARLQSKINKQKKQEKIDIEALVEIKFNIEAVINNYESKYQTFVRATIDMRDKIGFHVDKETIRGFFDDLDNYTEEELVVIMRDSTFATQLYPMTYDIVELHLENYFMADIEKSIRSRELLLKSFDTNLTQMKEIVDDIEKAIWELIEYINFLSSEMDKE
ncbi:MAG: hypothetical protein ACK4NC_06380 [Candidatus Gracilibacteria bacterium]